MVRKGERPHYDGPRRPDDRLLRSLAADRGKPERSKKRGHLVGPDADRRAGSVLGDLAAARLISGNEYTAGEHYLEIYIRAAMPPIGDSTPLAEERISRADAAPHRTRPVSVIGSTKTHAEFFRARCS